MNPPGVCVGYRLDSSQGSSPFFRIERTLRRAEVHSVKSLLLSPEAGTRSRAEQARSELVEFLRRCDVLILDTQYTDDEYKAHVAGDMALSAPLFPWLSTLRSKNSSSSITTRDTMTTP